MTDAQTEARAIAQRLMLPDEDVFELAVDIIATALEAQAAELATLREADGNFWEAIARAERAEAAHAEARKALDTLGAFAFWFQKYPEFKPNPDMQAEMLADLDRARPFIPARRALEAQGGENG